MSHEYTPPITLLPNGRMTAKNAALYLGIAEKTLAMYRCEGKGPRFTKVGGKIYYSKDSLEAWLDGAGEFTSTAQARFHAQKSNLEG